MNSISESLCNYLIQNLDEEAKEYVSKSCKFKLFSDDYAWDKIQTRPFSIKSILEDMNPMWILKAINELKSNKDKELAFNSLPSEIIENSSDILNFKKLTLSKEFSRLIFNEVIVPKIHSPISLIKKEFLLSETLGSLLTINYKQCKNLIYILGLQDISSSISGTIDSSKKRKVFESIDEKFKKVFNIYLMNKDHFATPSITCNQIVSLIDSGQGIESTIYSYGIYRLAAVIKFANSEIRKHFFKISGPNIQEGIEKTIPSLKNVNKKESKYFIRSLLNSIFYLTGDNYD